MLTPKVSFLPMKHLNRRNETIFLRNETICLNYFLYICGMKGHSVCREGRLCMSGYKSGGTAITYENYKSDSKYLIYSSVTLEISPLS